MEPKQENSSTPPPANIPEWVMHLLTGLGTMGAEYMLFIKPLQEKMELQSRLLKEQNERIEDLEELLQNRRKTKPNIEAQNEEQSDDINNELFQIKRKPASVNKYARHARIKL